MEIGVIFPQAEIPPDPVQARDFAQAAEALRFDHLVAYDHVLGADQSFHRGLTSPYDYRAMFLEPLTLFAYLAGLTKRIGFASSVLILPQRQTALVAKQAAVVDVLSKGRLRLGVGLGWNPVEYQALGENWRNRGARIEEQIALLRRLWTEELIDFEGKWHRFQRAGINPLPVQRPIPLWMGAGQRGIPPPERAVERIARLADGWFSHLRPDAEGAAGLERFRNYARAAGRDPKRIGIEGRVLTADGGPDDWARTVEAYRQLGFTHLGFLTINAGFSGLEQHLEAMRRFREAVPGS
jgi:probable F420-dependent oxidoreductase